MSSEPKPTTSKLIFKEKPWSPDTHREEAWLKRKRDYHRMQRSRSMNFTDTDLDDLQVCFELGFGFEIDSPELDPRLSSTFPALEFYHAVNKQYSNGLKRSSSSMAVMSEFDTSSAAAADADGSPTRSLFDPSDDPEMKKMRLRQWAKVVGCTVRQYSLG